MLGNILRGKMGKSKKVLENELMTTDKQIKHVVDFLLHLERIYQINLLIVKVW